MSVSIKPFCRRERISKNQTTIVQLRVTINRRSRYVSTGIRVPISEWDFEKQEPLATSGHIKCEIFDKINSYQKRIKQLEAFDIEVTLDDLLDDEKAKFLIANLLLIDPHYYQISGVDENDCDMTNHLSYLILEAADSINISCNLTVRYHENCDRE